MHKNSIKFLMAAFFSMTLSTLMASTVISGDSTVAGETFSLNYGTFLHEPSRDLLIVGAAQISTCTAASAPYAISYSQSGSSFVPLVGAAQATIATGTIVTQLAQTNPLYGASINQLSMMIYNPAFPYLVATPSTAPGTVYLLKNNLNQNLSPFALLSTGTLLDTQNFPTPKIVALTTSLSMLMPVPYNYTTGLIGGSAVYAAVTNQAGVFGQEGSGIAGAYISNTGPFPGFITLPTAPLNTMSPAPAIGAPLSAMGNFVTMINTVSPALTINPTNSQPTIATLSVVYVGLQVQAGAADPAGACAVLMFPGFTNNFSEQGQITFMPPAKINLSPIITATATVVTSDSIVAATGPLATVNIYHMTSMTTTTKLRYLIVVGGVVPYGTPSTVFALPLVTESGALANVNAQPINSFGQNGLLDQRTLPAAAALGDLYTSSSVPAKVGGGAALPGEVTSIETVGDTVFATVATATAQNPGIFYSQALFASAGTIKGWTQWQRVGNNLTPTFGSALDIHTGNFWSMLQTGSAVFNTVQRTQWTSSPSGIMNVFNQLFSLVEGGIQEIFEFPSTTPVFDQTSPLAITLATGNNQVALVQTGQTTAGLFGPVTNTTSGFVQTNGTLQGFSPGVSWLSLSGGALATLGPIIAATVITDGTYGWFAVAGAHGVAVLARPDGTGWSATTGLQNGFAGLTDDMSWILVGNNFAVRKLINNANGLYILTNSTLTRMNIAASTFAQGEAAPAVLLAQGGNLPGGLNTFLSDAIIAQKVGVLATSSGLLRVGNGADITSAQSEAELNWTPIALNGNVGPVNRLFGISATGLAQDIVQTAPAVSGNIYVLNSYVGYDQTRIYRLDIEYSGTIDDTTIAVFNDIYYANTPTFFLTLPKYRNYLTTDGSILAVSRSKYLKDYSFLEILAPTWLYGSSLGLLNGAKTVVKDLKAHHIGQMIRSSVTGSWLVPDESGLSVNE